MPFSVLLVCTGNTCRSAMAEGLLRSLLPSDSASDVVVSSAGTANLVGAPATDHAREVALAHGVNIDGHVSRGVTPEVLAGADLVLAMTRGHADHIAVMEPAAADRTVLLSEFADGSDEDVPDPIGGPREEYEVAFRMMEAYLKKALPKILDMAGEEKQ